MRTHNVAGTEPTPSALTVGVTWGNGGSHTGAGGLPRPLRDVAGGRLPSGHPLSMSTSRRPGSPTQHPTPNSGFHRADGTRTGGPRTRSPTGAAAILEPGVGAPQPRRGSGWSHQAGSVRACHVDHGVGG